MTKTRQITLPRWRFRNGRYNKRNRWGSITKSSSSSSSSSSNFSFPSFLLLEEEVHVAFFHGLIIMVIGDSHESGTRLTVARFTESRADEKEKGVVVVVPGRRSSIGRWDVKIASRKQRDTRDFSSCYLQTSLSFSSFLRFLLWKIN